MNKWFVLPSAVGKMESGGGLIVCSVIHLKGQETVMEEKGACSGLQTQAR